MNSAWLVHTYAVWFIKYVIAVLIIDFIFAKKDITDESVAMLPIRNTYLHSGSKK